MANDQYFLHFDKKIFHLNKMNFDFYSVPLQQPVFIDPQNA